MSFDLNLAAFALLSEQSKADSEHCLKAEMRVELSQVCPGNDQTNICTATH